jgi:hypothetical protein
MRSGAPGRPLASASGSSIDAMAEFHQPGFKRRPIAGLLLVAALTPLCPAAASAAAQPKAPTGGVCRAPRLTRLTLEAARRRATHAGCRLSVKGAPLEDASIQTVERQSPAPGRRSASLIVSLNPFCRGSAAYGPAIKEPAVTTGPAELVSGFYLNGGPLARFSYPHCRRPEPKPGAGTVAVLDASGDVVATKTSKENEFVRIPLAAGSYTIRGTFLDAEINFVHPMRTESVVIPAGHTVRQDFSLSIP